MLVFGVFYECFCISKEAKAREIQGRRGGSAGFWSWFRVQSSEGLGLSLL